MAYEKIGPFVSKEDPDFNPAIHPAVSGPNLTHIDDGVAEAHRLVEEIELTPGPEGPQGDRGPAGADAEPQFTEEEVITLKALAADAG